MKIRKFIVIISFIFFFTFSTRSANAFNLFGINIPIPDPIEIITNTISNGLKGLQDLLKIPEIPNPFKKWIDTITGGVGQIEETIFQDPIQGIFNMVTEGIGGIKDTIVGDLIFSEIQIEDTANSEIRQFIENLVRQVEKAVAFGKPKEVIRAIYEDAIRQIDEKLKTNLDIITKAILIRLKNIFQKEVDKANSVIMEDQYGPAIPGFPGTTQPPIETEDITAGNRVILPWYATKKGVLGEIGQERPQLGTVVSKIIPYVYVFAGLSLLVMLIWGGITLMTAASNADKAKSGYGMISGSLIGFLIVFISYFVLQIVQVVLGIQIF